MDLFAIFATVAFAGAFVGSTLLAGDGFGLGRRAAGLERRDPGRAEALRLAEALGDYRRGGGILGDDAFGPVCTPSRRSALDMARVRASDVDPRSEAPDEALPELPAIVVMLPSGVHLVPPGAPRHPTMPPQRTRPARVDRSTRADEPTERTSRPERAGSAETTRRDHDETERTGRPGR